MNKILLNILGVAIVVALLLFGYLGISLLELEKKRATNEARYQCANSSKYETRDGNAIVSYPAKDPYELCLREKGIE